MTDEETVEAAEGGQNAGEATAPVEETVETTPSGEGGDATTPVGETAGVAGEGDAGSGEAAAPEGSDFVSKREHEKRVGKLTTDKYDLERDREYWKQEALSRSGSRPPVKEPEPAPKPALVKPKIEDYEDEAGFHTANTRYEVQEALRDRDERDRDTKATEVRTAAKREQELGISKMIEAGRNKYPEDFNDIALSKEVVYSDDVCDLMLESETPEDIAYYLGKNKEEARRLSGLTKVQVAREIGKLEVRLGQKGKKVTTAPAPISPISSSQQSGEKDPNKMSTPEWIAHRKQELATKAKEA